jgi:excisionase family DNA binding protein
MEDAMLTTPEAAFRLGVSPERVRQLINVGRLPSKQYGRDHLIRESDLALVAVRKVGRPSKRKASAVDSEVSTAIDAPDEGAPAGIGEEKPAKPAAKRKKGTGQ